jgi:hypothetical protein
LKQLIERRSALFAEYDKIKAALDAEKRTAYSNEEREAVKKIKLEIADLDARIADEKAIEEKRNQKLDFVASSAPAIISNRNTVFTEFRNLAIAGNGKMSLDNVFQRSDITTSSNDDFKYTHSATGLSIDNGELVLDALGAKTYFFESGNVSFPSITSIEGAFATTEGGAVADRTLTDASKVLTPRFVSASLTITKSFIAQSKPENIQDLINELKYGIEKAVEARALNSMTGLTAVSSGSTLYASVLNMEAAVKGAGTGYIFSASGTAKAKQSKVGTDQTMVWKDGMVNGYAAKRSVLISANHCYYGDFRSVAKAYWGGMSVEFITDATLAASGRVLVIASALADSSYTDSAKVSVLKNVNAY